MSLLSKMREKIEFLGVSRDCGSCNWNSPVVWSTRSHFCLNDKSGKFLKNPTELYLLYGERKICKFYSFAFDELNDTDLKRLRDNALYASSVISMHAWEKKEFLEKYK